MPALRIDRYTDEQVPAALRQHERVRPVLRVSIWASVGFGEPDIVCYTDGYGNEPDPATWIDVATGWDSIRLIVECEVGTGLVILPADSARALIRRLETAVAVITKQE